MIANKAARREISIVTPTWYFHWHLPAVKLQNIEHLAKTTSNPAVAKARGWSVSRWEFDVRCEISVFIPKWHSLCIFSYRHSLLQKMWDVNTMRQHPRNLPCRCQTAWFEVNWKTDARARSWLQERLSSYICIPSQCDTLNTWLERLTETTKSRNFHWHNVVFVTPESRMSELRCLSSC